MGTSCRGGVPERPKGRGWKPRVRDTVPYRGFESLPLRMPKPTPISAYVLTFNSERYLAPILQALRLVADELILIDSGSTDRTLDIAKQMDGIRIVHRPLQSFRDQRLFAEQICTHDWILFLDSDELPAKNFVPTIQQWKRSTPAYPAYRLPRYWYVLGRRIHAFFPIVSPDAPIRLYNRQYGSFAQSTEVHETPMGFSHTGTLPTCVHHYTFHDWQELHRKLEQYTTLAARDLLARKQKQPTRLQQTLSSIAAFIKWYLFKRGFLDGKVGLIGGWYAFLYTWKKYQKARQMLKTLLSST